MHELALSRAILQSAVSHADGLRVRTVRLRVGELRQVVPASLDFYFGVVAAGTPCEGARLEQERVPARLRCACGREWTLAAPDFRCSSCGAAGAVVGGEELEIESIDVEEG